jgi:hypothetical protein
MTDRDEIRAEMNSAYENLPQWIAQSFSPIRDAVSILFDRCDDILARDLVLSIPIPSNLTQNQEAEFSQSKSAMIAAIDLIINIAIESNPLNSPEAIAMLALSAERRAS